jgi:hypothetical protein
MARIATGLIYLFLVPLLAGADDAVLPGGERVKGELSLTKAGRLHFVPQKGPPPDAAEYYLSGRPAPFRAGGGMLLKLPGGQEVSGLFLGLERDNLIFRTAWSDRLEVPRRAVVALTHLPGWRPIFRHDLNGKLTGWSVQGTPAVESSGVVLSKPGQSLTCKPGQEIAEGRLGVNFREEARPAGARWVVEAVFRHKGGDRVVSVTLAGTQLEVDSGGLMGTAGSVTRGDGWRRLWLDFTTGSLRIGVDDEVLWYTLTAGPGGPLRQVRLACTSTEKSTPAGSVLLSNFVLERAVTERPHPRGDPKQDELWLAGGDQVFGEVVRADASSVELKGRFGVRRFIWSQLRGWFLRKSGDRLAAPRAPVVQLGIRSGLRPTADVLEATLTALDAEQVKLTHPVLGTITLDRGRVAWLRPRRVIR